MADEEEFDESDFAEILANVAAPAPPSAEKPKDAVEIALEDFDGLDDFLDNTGIQQESRVKARGGSDLRKPWMKFHKFTLVKSVEEVKDIVDAALKHGRCALDLECQGLDNRIDYDEDGAPYTRHKNVGYCISVKGAGYYIPVRHEYVTGMDQDPNLPVVEVESEIKRLCLASQPELTEAGKAEDALASRDWAKPPQVIIYFWNAKFDQECLYPVTGIDSWHPDSFEDGYLAAYTFYTDDKEKGLKAKAAQKLSITDPETGEVYPYEMIEFEDLFMKGVKKANLKFHELYPEEGSDIVLYGCSDAICTELLCEIKKVKWDYAIEPKEASYDPPVKDVQKAPFVSTYRLEKQTVQAVRVMERNRTLIDKEAVAQLLEEAKAEKDAYLQKITTLAESKGFKNFNPGSTEQLSDFLFSEKGLDINPKPKKTESGEQYKTDAATLEGMAESHPDIEVLLWVVKYRQIDKVIGTYLTGFLDNCDEKNQLRFQFKQTGAATGRFTAPAGKPEHGYSGIPIQGIPARSDPKKPKVAHSQRRIFVSHEGYTFVKIDYAGQELRVVTNLSKEPLWLKEFKEGTGDLHTITAQAFFGQHITKADTVERNMGKIANFSLIYGGGTQAIQRATKCDKVEAARRKESFDKSVSTFARWVKKQHASVKKHLGVSTAFGRFIRIPDANVKPGDLINGATVDEKDAKKIRAGCERKSTNYPIQGSGADILKISLVRLNKELRRRGWLREDGGDDSVRMIMTVHDEIVFEIKHERLQEALPIIIDIMESPSRLAKWEIPLIVEPLVGLNWAGKHDWLEIMSGKEPVPDWLVGHVNPEAQIEVELPKDPVQASRQAPAPSLLKDDPEVEAETPQPAPVSEKAPENEVVTFTLPRNYQTRESIRLVMLAISGAVPIGEDQQKDGRRLRLRDQAGGTLIQPTDGIYVDPERFSQQLRERNLGLGVWDVTEEDL